MKIKFTLLYLFLLFVVAASAQNITGIWKGYFVQKSLGFFEDRYRFEVQLAQADNNGVQGVTYSYKTTVFYGKAELTGIFTSRTKNIVIKETRLVEVKIAGQSSPCLMTCYLDYSRMGDMETLTGTYTSRNLNDGGDCGSGRIYLEKSAITDFYKEDFLVKRENELKRKDEKTNRTKPNTYKPPVAKTTTPKQEDNKIKPGAEDNLISDKLDKKIIDSEIVIAPNPPKEESIIVLPVPDKNLPKPLILKQRDNELVKTITTSSRQLKIELYDNGEIDGDTITVYHNNECIVNRQMLTDKPITFNISLDENDNLHEFVMVANNMGSIPPNTALMIITAGTKRYELFITSTEQKNAVVVVEYKPQK